MVSFEILFSELILLQEMHVCSPLFYTNHVKERFNQTVHFSLFLFICLRPTKDMQSRADVTYDYTIRMFKLHKSIKISIIFTVVIFATQSHRMIMELFTFFTKQFYCFAYTVNSPNLRPT